MSKQKRNYTAVYKRNAVKLSKEKGNVAKAARELGIGAQLIHRWKKELRDAKMEAEILKKAIGIFSANDSKNLDS